MPIDVRAVQQALRDQGLDGWLLYDFQGANPIAQRLAGIGRDGGHLASRRWFYLIPVAGEPRGLVHKIERHNLDRLPGAKTPYAGRLELEAGLKQLLSGTHKVAMEYSPNGAIPYVSRVDAGTLEMVRGHGIDVVSSGDLVQQFEAHWNTAAIASHTPPPSASIASRIAPSRRPPRGPATVCATTEYDLQQLMWQWFPDEGLVSDSAPNVSAQENAGNPHYLPTQHRSRPIRPNELLLLDLWGKLKTPGAVFADITWVGFTGPKVPAEMATPLPRFVTRATRRSESSRSGAVRAARCAALKSIARHGRSSSRRDTARTSCIAPDTASAKPCTAMARTSTTTKRTTNAGCCPEPASRSNRASISMNSAYGRKSTWCGVPPVPK